MMTQLNITRALLVFGFLYGLTSLLATFNHIGDPAYLVQAEFGGGQAHSWYQALHEAFGDIATLIVVLFVFLPTRKYASLSPGGFARYYCLVITCPIGLACRSLKNWLHQACRQKLTI
ncbi:MAG: hypothetical protein P8M72_03390 [Gammaproteobacteria bacterium]|nr:hypothetical protein [Gammaproteobacteria bacterium]